METAPQWGEETITHESATSYRVFCSWSAMGATASIPRERSRASDAVPWLTHVDVQPPAFTAKPNPARTGCSESSTKLKRSKRFTPARPPSKTYNVSDATEFVTPKPGAEWVWCNSCKKQFRIRRRQQTSEAHRCHLEDRRARRKLFLTRVSLFLTSCALRPSLGRNGL